MSIRFSNFAAETVGEQANKREPGESPGQSRCGKFHKQGLAKKPLSVGKTGGKASQKPGTSPKTCRFCHIRV